MKKTACIIVYEGKNWKVGSTNMYLSFRAVPPLACHWRFVDGKVAATTEQGRCGAKEVEGTVKNLIDTNSRQARRSLVVFPAERAVDEELQCTRYTLLYATLMNSWTPDLQHSKRAVVLKNNDARGSSCLAGEVIIPTLMRGEGYPFHQPFCN
jgi:hypothetical protein